MKQLKAALAVSTLLLGAAVIPCAWCADEISVAGVVRDAHGAPLLGALVQLLGPHALVVAQAVTDEHGRYSLRTGTAGEYQLHASDALLLPVTVAHLRLQPGVRAAANLIMLAPYGTAALLPADKRMAAEPADDWRWTLRSIANRPLLRLVDASGSAPPITSPKEALLTDSAFHGRFALGVKEGGLGEDGTHAEVALRREGQAGTTSMLKADLDGTAQPGSDTAYVVAAGVQRDRGLEGGSRFMVSYGSYADLRAGDRTGVRVLRAAATDKVCLGDLLTVDAGTLVSVEQMQGSAFLSAPFLRVAFQPSPSVRVEYHLATDSALQRSEDLDSGSVREQLVSGAGGQPMLRRALHQAVSVTQSTPKRDVSLALYRDQLPVEVIEGEGGLVTAAEAAELPMILDTQTGRLRVAVAGYAATGVALSWSEAITPSVFARVEGQFGTALSGNGSVLRLADLRAHLHPGNTAALTGTLTVRASETGTVLHVRYRWQPAPALTRVDEFEGTSPDSFFGLDVRQRLCRGRHLHEIDAVLDAANLLDQGEEIALSPRGKAVHLAQTPRSLQGGLSISF